MQKDDLWQGGDWEHPNPFVPPLIPEVPEQKKKKHIRRPVLIFASMLTLICGLMAATLYTRYAPARRGNREDPLPAQTQHEQKPLPQAKTGTGVTLTISPAGDTPLTYTQVYEKNEHSIVTIYAMDGTGMNHGTGIIMTANGYIITNAHVIQNAVSVTVIVGEDILYDAALVGSCPEEDLAVLKVDAEHLTPAEFGDSFAMRVGDEVSALGNPMGYRMTMTPGIISAVDREMQVDNQTMYLLQTSAAINFGNSGGALFNNRGQVIGVTVIKIVADDGSAEGLGFAIPTERVKYVVDHLIAGEEIKVPYLGITVQPSEDRSGLSVVAIQPDSDAASKGLQVGDIILSANGRPVRTNRALQRIKELCRVGDTLTLEILRGEEQLEYSIVLRDYDVLYPENGTD